MPVKPFAKLPAECEAGLNFGTFFEDRETVAAALRVFAAAFEPSATCYCLQFHCVENGISHFEPYGVTDGLDGVSTDASFPLPTKITYSRLLHREANEERWLPLARWYPDPQQDLHLPPAIMNSVWCGLVRLQAGGKYVGYFKVVLTKDQGLEEDELNEQLIYAFWRTKSRLPEILVRRALGLGFKPGLEALHRRIAEELRNGRADMAIRFFATLMTSHLVRYPFNRIIVLAPKNPDRLVCVYGHGGDCSAAFSARVQSPFADRVGTIEELIDYVYASAPPTDDPLFAAAVRGKDLLALNSVGSSASLVARLWRERGNLKGFADDQVIATVATGELRLPHRPVVYTGPSRLAVQFTRDDPWLRELKETHPESALWSNRNTVHFAVPWLCGGEVLLVVLDLGFWDRYDPMRDVVPRLLVARALLDEFAVDFENIRW